MPLEIPPHYARRVSEGIYDSMVAEIQNRGQAYLLNCEYERDFFRKTGWSDGYVYQTPGGNEFRVVVFGEIKPAAMGTRHSAIGSHYKGDLREGGKVCFSLLYSH